MHKRILNDFEDEKPAVCILKQQRKFSLKELFELCLSPFFSHEVGDHYCVSWFIICSVETPTRLSLQLGGEKINKSSGWFLSGGTRASDTLSANCFEIFLLSRVLESRFEKNFSSDTFRLISSVFLFQIMMIKMSVLSHSFVLDASWKKKRKFFVFLASQKHVKKIRISLAQWALICQIKH